MNPQKASRRNERTMTFAFEEADPCDKTEILEQSFEDFEVMSQDEQHVLCQKSFMF